MNFKKKNSQFKKKVIYLKISSGQKKKNALIKKENSEPN